MDEIIELYNSNKLIVRAMDVPSTCTMDGKRMYDCTTWENEFEMMQLGKFSSVSSTLIVPNVPVRLYKNIGFLVNANTADCFHICKSDSCSHGNLLNGDFNASQADFNSVEELAEYIILNNSNEINEINLNMNLNDVKGLVMINCQSDFQYILLKSIMVVKECLKKITGIDYPIYMYDATLGKIDKVEITEELLDKMNKTFEEIKIYDSTYNLDDYMFYTYEDMKLCIGNVNEGKNVRS